MRHDRNPADDIVNIRAPLLLILAAGFLSGCAGGPTGAAEEGQRQYRASCAGCHGENGRGNGPIAPVLTVPVPDLTLIAARYDGRYPADEIYRIIDGQADLDAHGQRHMPVWGYEFFGDDPDDEVAHRQATQKIERVVTYLRSIQRTH